MDALSDLTPNLPEASRPTQLQLFEPAEITRPDINIGKWSGWIFASPWAKNLRDSWEHSWETELKGETVNASIKIRPVNGQKRLTTTSYRVFLGLVQIWELSGKPRSGEVSFSTRQLAHMLDMRWCGRSTANSLHEQIDILTNTSISWTFSFRRDGKPLPDRVYRDMHLLESNAYIERDQFFKDERFTRQQMVRLNGDLVANMIAGSTKPVNFREFISIRNDTSASLYTLLDLFLWDKKKWERRSLGLLYDDLDLSGARYQQRRLRLAKLKEFVAELDGKELSHGKLALSIEKTVDGEDYKLVARKIPRVQPKRRKPPKLANAEDDIPYIVEDIMDGLRRFPKGIAPDSAKFIGVLARWYPKAMLFDALSILKADYRHSIKKKPIHAFVYQVHIMAHERGLEWIKGCGKECKCRPENRKSLI